MTGNIFSYFVLFAWPAVVIFLFVSRPQNQALIWSVLGAQLILPEVTSFKIEMLPALDKNSVAVIAPALACTILASPKVRQNNQWGLTEFLLATYLVCPLVTSSFNGEPIILGSKILPAAGYYDAVSASIIQLLNLLPYLLGRRLLGASPDTEQILRALVLAALFYSLPMLLEIRLSPQLHHWIYGVFQSSFVNEGRLGGFRPTVFMKNGLAVAFFLLTSLIAAAMFWRIRRTVFHLAPGWFVLYLGVLLVLCKAVGALVYGLILVPVVRWIQPRRQIQIAMALVLIALSYPILRAYDFFPTDSLVETAKEFSVDRAASLKTRFDQEQQLLVHASSHFFFGWGRFGRSRVYDEYGKDVTLSDGRWIITMGTFGFMGFLAEFGLLVLPVLRVASAFHRVKTYQEQSLLAALTLIVGVSCIEQLPNDSLGPWMWLIAGALAGRADVLRRTKKPGMSHAIPVAPASQVM
ncbi:FUSC family membrane protein [Bradyrhizobium sp. WSM1417]|uniref:FUSC family membrane protein n=1 Tax=Bradyrhizobium sp. WSM1417 TaxID=754500 RepID=UPI0004B850A8|nr:hypothetical protein [Bradyrhizobium sp. WSM1417]